MEYYEHERAEGRVVRNKDLQRHVRGVAAGLQLEGFVPSDMWVNKWKKRNNISLRCTTSSNQKAPTDYEDQLMEF